MTFDRNPSFDQSSQKLRLDLIFTSLVSVLLNLSVTPLFVVVQHNRFLFFSRNDNISMSNFA